MEKILIDDLDFSKLDKTKYIKEMITSESGVLEILFLSSFSNSSIIRELILIIGTVLGLEKIWRSRLVLIVDELVNNSIEYGSNPGDQNKLRFIYNKTQEKVDIAIEVEDTGNGELHKSAFEMNKIKNAKLNKGFDNYRGVRGRGLFLIIMKLVDDLYFTNTLEGGLTVGIKKTFLLKKG